MNLLFYQVYLVLWYKVTGAGDEGEPIYSYDARHGTWNLGARWSDARHGFGERAYFQLSSSPAELRLEDVREDEAGLYRCRVDFKVSGTLISQLDNSCLTNSVHLKLNIIHSVLNIKSASKFSSMAPQVSSDDAKPS